MLASNPSTEPEAEMREGGTPDLPSPTRPNPSRHQAPNAGVRGRAPSEFASGSPSFADNLRPSALRTAVFSPISHLFAKTSAGAFFRHGFRIHKNGLFKARTTIALTRYWTKLPELTSARGNLVFASEPTRPPPPSAGPPPPWLCPTTSSSPSPAGKVLPREDTSPPTCPGARPPYWPPPPKRTGRSEAVVRGS